MTTIHVPILVTPIVEALLAPLRDLPADSGPHWLVDCTLGGGGHTAALLAGLSAEPALQRHKVLALDRDPGAVELGRERFHREIDSGQLQIVHSRFSQAAEIMAERPTLGLMADLGFSSDQMGDPSRGLSFQDDGPLDMRLDPTSGESAREFLDQVTERELEKVLLEYGEERFARRIAAALIHFRRTHGTPPSTTRELSETVIRAIPPKMRHGRIHAATRTFQALRIVVNQELEELDCLLKHVILSVNPGGRVAILSFHSLEDRMVKHAFRRAAFKQLTKKPIEADELEVQANPRSRSAKLRIAQRQDPEGDAF